MAKGEKVLWPITLTTSFYPVLVMLGEQVASIALPVIFVDGIAKSGAGRSSHHTRR